MAVGGSLSMFIPPIPRLCPIASSSSPRSTSSVKHLLPTICSPLREVETWRNERASSVSPCESVKIGAFVLFVAGIDFWGKELERGCLDGAGGRSLRIRMLFTGQCGDNRARSSDWFGRSDFMEDGLANIKDNPFTVAGSEKPYSPSDISWSSLIWEAYMRRIIGQISMPWVYHRK
ncbi:hypothetical protein MLD38_019672 [Melastoma candidum]|uniref:Uncharacterized protein n=1 Tax=Melastoma candidum TaxID=119954 RepID=A0ACB9R0U6_9MYRT|nr:hypothetical protein MLD38_019672 [Melastoma candidum]